MPVSFVPSAPSHQPLQFSQPGTPTSSADPHAVSITITDDDGIERVFDLSSMPEPKPSPQAKSLLSAICSGGFMQTLTARIAPHLDPGSPAWKALNMVGCFNVNQIACEIPTGIPGVSSKLGWQANLVKPPNGLYLQLFFAHDEFGFNLPQAFSRILPENFLPAWCGLSAQIIRNHGFNIPIVHTDAGWELGGFGGENGIEYMEEWVIRPAELDLPYLDMVQFTAGAEFGTQMMWDMDSEKAKWAFAANAAANAIGMSAGFATAAAAGGNAMAFMHGGAMLGQLAAHGLQCGGNAMHPDKIIVWAGATFGPTDVNAITPPGASGRLTNYFRGWWHAYDHCRRVDLKQEAEASIADFFQRQRQNHAIEMAEMGIDPTTVPTQTSPPTISERYAAQS